MVYNFVTESKVFVTTHGEDFMILACAIFIEQLY